MDFLLHDSPEENPCPAEVLTSGDSRSARGHFIIIQTSYFTVIMKNGFGIAPSAEAAQMGRHRTIMGSVRWSPIRWWGDE